MSFKVKTHAASHDENRKKICLICREKKENMKSIGEEMKNKLHSVTNYNFTDIRLPTSICSSCRIKVYKCSETSEQSLVPIDYSKFSFPRKATRSNDESICQCTLCDLVRNDIGFSKKKRLLSKKSVPPIIKKCGVCFSEIAKGKSHVCKPSSAYNNIKTNVDEYLQEKGKEHLTCELIKNHYQSAKDQNLEVKDINVIKLSQKHGKPLVVNLFPKTCSYSISADDLFKLQTRFNLSLNEICGIASFIRIALKSRNVIEKDLKNKISHMCHRVDEFFEVAEADFLVTKGTTTSQEKREFVFCKNVIEFSEFIKQERHVDNTHYKIGIDGGGGFLKICLSLLNGKSDPTNNLKAGNCEYQSKKLRLCYEDGFKAGFLDSSVKKLFVIGIVPCTQENFENVSLLWLLLKLDKIKSTVATDLKLANILIGIMSHASKYPCTWCLSSCNELNGCKELRTIGNCLRNVKAWVESGSKKEAAKLFNNCVNNPLFDCDENTAIIDLIPPPELHLLIGVVNTLYEKMLLEFKTESEEWVENCYVAREVYYSKPSFNGNSSRKLLRNVKILENISNKYGRGCLKYVECFKNFDLLVTSCFSDKLDENFESHIRNFKKSYIALKINITPKAHAIFEHVPYFCKKYNRGLGFYSEQAMESVHADFKKIWTKYKVDQTHPDYAGRLLKAITEYNSRHI